MKLKFTSIFALLFVATIVFGQTQKPVTVGILKFQSHFIMLGKDTTSLLTAELSADPRFSFVDRGQLQQVLDEEALDASGIISPDSAAKIGQLTGAKVLVGGRVLKDKNNNVTILASIIGTENGRMFSETEIGPRTNLEAMTSEMAKKIAQTIADQSTNLIVTVPVSREERIAQLIKNINGKQRPAVSVKINEQMPGDPTAHQTAETELGLLLQKAGFTVVDEKSDQKADVIITGDAILADSQKTGKLFSGHAILEIKAQQRTTGKILSLDRQEGVAVDVSEAIAAKQALENATDDLAERLLPLLSQ